MISEIIKRDGRCEAFNPEKITHAIFKAAIACGGKDFQLAEELRKQVVKVLEER